MKMQETLSTLQRDDSISSDSNKEFHADRLSEEEEDEAPVIPQTHLGNRSRSQPNLRRVAPILSTSSLSSSGGDSPRLLRCVERVLPNGDLYIGTFLGNAPHGTGKYLWADGCMYEGEWRKGKASGKGRFSWPSGATYEGEFRSGRMDGYGIFTGTDGDTYRGFWVADKKQGHGEKLYANGDVYDGNWKNNTQDGEGKYVWKNGNVYHGEWQNGVLSGRGLLIWANGNKYEGHWENGNPKGAGVFTRSDGSTYAGNWGNEMENEQCGQLPTTNTKKLASVDGGRHSLSERGVNFPRICIWEADEEAGDITCDILDKVEASKLYREARDSCNGLIRSPRQCQSRAQSPRPYWSGGGDDEIKKPGQTISIGHKNYELMLNLQLGIRHSVGKHASKTRNLKPSDFEPREKYWTRFPTEGSKCTPPHQSVDFKWKDYCPLVFRHLRDLFGIDPADYMLAICGSDALREFSSPGKSGSCFYLTQDDRFMIKTVKKAEVKVLIKMLPNYYKHVYQYKNTLVTKFFGVHCVKPIGGQKTRFVVMANLFHSEYRIHKRFDLKGSSHGRWTDRPDGEIDETTTLKDLDLNFVFRLQKSWFEELIRQIDRDCEFLEAERIMDYSLLIGLHFRDDYDDMIKSPTGIADDWNSPRMDNLAKIDPRDTDWIMDGRRPFIRLGANMPARAERVMKIEFEQNASFGRSNGTCSRNGTPRNGTPNNGTPLSGTPRARGRAEIFEVVLYFGIIDILQDYDISKKLEHAYKSWQVDPTSISAVDPRLYSKRFRDFLNKIFVEDE